MEMDSTKRLPGYLDVVVMVQKVRRACTFRKSAHKKQQQRNPEVDDDCESDE